MADRALEIVSMKDPAQFGLDPSALAVGDRIIEVAGEVATDQLDWAFYASKGKSVSIRVQKKNGLVEDVVLPSRAVAGLEIWFKAMDFRRCRCKCPFCFVDQMPKGLRASLYIKDEDFRLSFLYGNFTTMNDVTDEELQKIIRQKNSPQWVSVHVVDEDMRRFVFGRPMKRKILDTLRLLADGDIRIHTQAVIVPGKNDGAYLRETIETLEALHENIVTLGVVPVGLTRHREGLPGMRVFRNDEMEGMIAFIETFQDRFLTGPRASRFVFASDEWYAGAGREVPAFDAYEGFPQLDNGVGSIRHFVSDAEADIDALGVPHDLGGIRIVTGALGEGVFTRYVFPLLQERGVGVMPELVRVRNVFFGETVTCSGLLVGEDMVAAVRETAGSGRRTRRGGRVTFLPPNCFNHDGVTIDEMSVEAISEALGARAVVPGDSLVESLHQWADGSGAGA